MPGLTVETFEHLGYRCTITMHPELGTLCGYIDVPPGHPWWGRKGLDEIVVHGGVTWVGANGPDWRIGFDCAHAGDGMPLVDHMLPPHLRAPVRGVTFVREQCRLLAVQAVDAVVRDRSRC